METLGPLGIPLSQNSLGAQKMMNLTGSDMRRKTFSDVTNIMSNQTMNVNDSVIMLFKENNMLMRLLEERNKIIENTALELQKLKICVQRLTQQNCQLSQANSQMLAEYNLGKDRLKAMQHELGCTIAILKARTTELQEEKKMNKQFKKLKQKVDTELPNNSTCSKPIEDVIDFSLPVNCKIPDNSTSRKRPLRSRSLGPSNVTCQVTAKEKDESRRKSLRKACNNTKTELCEPTIKKLFEIKDSELCEPPTEKLFEIEDLKLPIRSDDDDTKVDEAHKGKRASSPLPLNLGLRRSSIGRPVRKAAEKVNSYKEKPINVKMRNEQI